MHQRKYFTSNFFINEIFSVEKFPNYGSYSVSCQLWAHLSLLWALEYTYLVFERKRYFAPKTDVCLCNADHTPAPSELHTFA